MTNQKKTDYICISKESEGPAPDTLDETLPIELLKSRGLNIADSSKAAKLLDEVYHFRFVLHLRPMEADKTIHQI